MFKLTGFLIDFEAAISNVVQVFVMDEGSCNSLHVARLTPRLCVTLRPRHSANHITSLRHASLNQQQEPDLPSPTSWLFLSLRLVRHSRSHKHRARLFHYPSPSPPEPMFLSGNFAFLAPPNPLRHDPCQHTWETKN